MRYQDTGWAFTEEWTVSARSQTGALPYTFLRTIKKISGAATICHPPVTQVPFSGERKIHAGADAA